MKELSIREGIAFILVFDLTKEESLNSLISLREKIIEIKQKYGKSEKLHMILVGNKSDLLDHDRDTSILEKAKSLALDVFKCFFMDISAKCSAKERIAKIFTSVAELIYKEIEEQMNTIKINSRRNSTTLSIGRRISIIRRESLKHEPNLLRRFSEPASVEIETNSKNNKNLKLHNSLMKQNKNCLIS